MERKIDYTYLGVGTSLAGLSISRMLPNSRTEKVGPFVFLDYIQRKTFEPKVPTLPDIYGEHPHRGIATFTYLLDGELEHYDSRENFGVVTAGGAQWMNAGNGLVHNENFSKSFQMKGGIFHGIQCWINLTSKIKKKLPEYMPFHDNDFPKLQLPNDAGFLKVLLGSYLENMSKVKTYSSQFMYHLQISPSATFELEIPDEMECAAFIANGNLNVNSFSAQEGALLTFKYENGSITMKNSSDRLADALTFGGASFLESSLSKGPFVMNSEGDLLTAYQDYKEGKYGKIDYSLAKY